MSGTHELGLFNCRSTDPTTVGANLMRVDNSIQVSHDPFARASLMRRQHSRPKQGCDWCGNWNGYGKLFEYGTEADGLRSHVIWHKGWFCGLPCHDAYHGFSR